MTTPSLAPAIGKQCAEQLFKDWRSYRCHTTARNHEGGKDWCKIHTPSIKAEKQRKWTEKFQADSERDRRIYERRAAELAALVGIANPAAVPEALAALDSLIGWATFNTDWAKAGRAGEEPSVHPLGRARIAFNALGLDRKEPA